MTLSTRRLARVTIVRRLVALATIAGLGLAFGAATISARPTEPSAADRQITLAVSMLMERQHLTGQELNDAISRRCLDTFIKELDPFKLFFLQSDIDEFREHESDLDNLFARGDIQFAYAVFARFLDRVDQGIQLAHAALDQEHDFTVDEEMIRDPEKAEFPRTPEGPDEGNGRRRRHGRGRQEARQALLEHSAKLAADR
jgi:carboxyl-terminal processing protease